MSDHKCPNCEKSYGRERDLRRHMTMKHPTTEPELAPVPSTEEGLMSSYKCPHCEKAYGRERDLRRHMVTKHDDDPTPPPAEQLTWVGTHFEDLKERDEILWDGAPWSIEQKKGLLLVVNNADNSGSRKLMFPSNRTPVRKMLV